MDNVVMKDYITQGHFQQIKGLLDNIDSIGEIKPMYMDQNINTYGDYQ